MKKLWDFDKFWVIWVSCAEKPRTLQEVQSIWNYLGNSLYQKGLKIAIWKEMVDSKFLEYHGRVKYRGVEGVLLHSTFDWIFDFLEENAKISEFEGDNKLPYLLLKSIKKRNMLVFLNKRRNIIYNIGYIKKLFINKENLKNYYEMCITAPLFSLVYKLIFSYISKEMGKDSVFLLSQPLIFFPSFSLNFLEYFKCISSNIEDKELSLIFDESIIFKVWEEYSTTIL